MNGLRASAMESEGSQLLFPLLNGKTYAAILRLSSSQGVPWVYAWEKGDLCQSAPAVSTRKVDAMAYSLAL
jgi:hypothetical protein